MITQDELVRTAERLRDALTAAADVMAEPDAAAVIAPVPQRPGRPRRARAWLILEDSWVEVRYPLTSEQEHGDRAAWPWLPGWVVSVCGPDEWEICVQASELARQHEGETVYPVCFRDASELRSLDAEPEAGS
jgi:hypothetical protein